MKTLHSDTHDWLLGPRWTVTQGPYYTSDDLIRFQKMSGSRKLLDQIARWTGDGWDPARWVPKPPTVPAQLRLLIEGQLKGELQP